MDYSGGESSLIQTRRILDRVADHVLGLSETLSATEDFMTEHFHDILSIRPYAMEDFQKLDFLNQSIIDTARLLRSLSQGVSDQKVLLEGLQLESTQLLVAPTQESPTTGKEPKGDVQLF